MKIARSESNPRQQLMMVFIVLTITAMRQSRAVRYLMKRELFIYQAKRPTFPHISVRIVIFRAQLVIPKCIGFLPQIIFEAQLGLSTKSYETYSHEFIKSTKSTI